MAEVNISVDLNSEALSVNADGGEISVLGTKSAGQQFSAQYAKEIALHIDIGADNQIIEAKLTDTDILRFSTSAGSGVSIRQYLASSLQL